MAVTKGSIAGPVVGVVGPGPGTEDSDVIVGITTISGGTNTYLLFDNNGILGEESVSTALDGIGAVRGDILYRGASGWAALAPGTAGQTLTTGGVGADPSWSAASFTLNSGTNFGITAPGLITLGNTYTIGATTDNLRFNDLGLGVAAPTSGGQIAQTLGANGITAHLIKRSTDSTPTGNFLDFQSAAAASLFTVSIAGVVTAGTWQATIVGPVYGGTGFGAYVLGDTLYADTTTTLAKLSGNTTTAKQYLSQTGNGTISAAPAWATISGGDITGAALTKTDDTNVTLTLGGTPATALLRATSLTLGWTGQLALAKGGTNANLTASNGGIFYSTATAGAILAGTATANQILLSGATAAPVWSTATYPATVAQGDLLYGSATNVLSTLAKNTTATRYLANTGTTNNPNWDQVNLTNGVTGTLPVGNGGIGLANPTAHDLLIGAGSSAMTQLAPAATSGIPLVSQGASADPAYSTAVVAGGGTGLVTATAYAVLCGGTTATGAFQSIASVGTSGQLLTSNGAGALPTMQSISTALDVLGSAQGDIIYRNASAWVVLTPGASGTVLSSNGVGTNPTWIAAGGTGTITSVTPGNGLTSTLTATAPGSAITTTGTLSGAELVNAQTGTSYTMVDGDRAKLVTASNAAAQAYSIAQAGAASAFQAGWFTDIKNLSTNVAGIVTITPTTSTINGASTLKIQPGQNARIVSDGTNYQVVFQGNGAQLPGTATNDSANAGNIGEFFEASASVSPAANAVADITSVPLTPGDWIVWGSYQSNFGATLSGGNVWINTASVTDPGFPNGGAYIALVPSTTNNLRTPVGMRRVSISTNTTVYLTGQVNWTGSNTGTGYIAARRVR